MDVRKQTKMKGWKEDCEAELVLAAAEIDVMNSKSQQQWRQQSKKGGK